MTGNSEDTAVDRDARLRAEDLLRESEARFGVLADSIPQLAWMARRDGWIFWYNKRWYDYTGTTFEDMQGWGWRAVHHPDHVDRVVARVQHSWQTGEAWEDTFPLRGRDGGWRWFLSRALPMRDQFGDVMRWFGTNTDITELREAEQRQQALLDELNHRVKNTLSIVQSLAQQSMRGASTLEVSREKFTGRLLALSQSHNILAREVWQGASLKEIVEGSLPAFIAADNPDRIQIHGPAVRLGPTVAVTLGIIFHELATNAAAYGALLAENGKVAVTWSTDMRGGRGPALELAWRESGGPPVTAPDRRGFGCRLIERGLGTETDAQCSLRFESEGLQCLFRIPLSGKVIVA